MLSPTIVKRLMLSRYLFNSAMAHANAHNEFASYGAANLLQDAVEIFLLAAAEHVNAKIAKTNEISTYFDKIDEKIAPKSLPFRLRLIQLNKIRVMSKHDAIAPDQKELDGLTTVVQEFLREATRLVFDVDYSSINLISLIDNPAVNELLTEADVALHERRFEDALVASRKAFFKVFEQRFDIKRFEGEELGALAGLGSDAPYFARSKEYIDKYVRMPFDYIVLDIQKIDSDLLKDRIDPVVFWNLWRLTPSVYQTSDGQWLVKHDLDKLHDPLEQNATYVLDNLIEILLRRQERSKSSKSVRNIARLKVMLATANAKVYQKADLECPIYWPLPDQAKFVDVTSRVPSLRPDQPDFWEVSYFEHGAFIIGFIPETDLDFEAHPPQTTLTNHGIFRALVGDTK